MFFFHKQLVFYHKTDHFITKTRLYHFNKANTGLNLYLKIRFCIIKRPKYSDVIMRSTKFKIALLSFCYILKKHSVNTLLFKTLLNYISLSCFHSKPFIFDNGFNQRIKKKVKSLSYYKRYCL